jgi:hypothetical protein
MRSSRLGARLHRADIDDLHYDAGASLGPFHDVGDAGAGAMLALAVRAEADCLGERRPDGNVRFHELSPQKVLLQPR